MFIWDRTADGRAMRAVKLQNQNGMEVTLLDFGARIQSIIVPNACGEKIDVVLGYDTAEEYVQDTESFGAIVGRNANRIGGASFNIDGITYQLNANQGENSLHSGPNGYQWRFFDIEEESDNSVTFRLESPDGDQRFPGNLILKVTYELTEKNELKLTYHAVTDQATICNPTNHVYLNLDGHESGVVLDHEAAIYADHYTPVIDEMCIPTGEIASVDDTPFDLRVMKKIGADVDADHIQIAYGHGYDHNYVLENDGNVELVARFRGASKGIQMEVETDLPGMQFYVGNWIPEKTGKAGAQYQRRSGFCLETQFFPDAIHHQNFVSPILRPDKPFESITIYRFQVMEGFANA